MNEQTSEFNIIGPPTSLAETSRYFLSNILESNNIRFYETWNLITIPVASDDEFYTLSPGEEGRWDLLSHKKYGTVLNWWIVCLANDIRNPLEILPAGTIIRLPSQETVIKLIRETRIKMLESRDS